MMRSRSPVLASLALMPSAMFSATVRPSNSEKCWNTPTLFSRASEGLWGRRPRHASRMSAFIGAHDAVDHLDQRRLAGAVLAQQGVDLLVPTEKVTSSLATTPETAW
jgi:hypothetical protein